MPPKQDAGASANSTGSRKRKDPPPSSSNSQKNGRGRDFKRAKFLDARVILSQTSDAALKNGELDLQSFLKAREFEIKALEDGMRRSKHDRPTGAFQQVPRDMRRRTASHNVKKVPKRLRTRAAREMKADNTPTVKSNKKAPKTSRGRLRAETAKRLGILGEKKRALKAKEGKETGGIETRSARPKIRRDKLNEPPKLKSKFRKRQIHKTWLPTHMWLAKRAHMTEPKNPLWRFSIPLTCTEKSYRPTHRAGGTRGAVCWDMSYMSTIGLKGPESSLEKLLKAMGLTEQGMWEEKGAKWRQGKRSWSGWISKQPKDKSILIGPSTVVWCPQQPESSSDKAKNPTKKTSSRRVFVRVHPSAFLETWTEVLRLSKQQRPTVHIEDLRFEIGSIDITGPGSTETLLGILHPFYQSEDREEEHAKMFTSLAGVTNPASLPSNSLLSFSIIDPRLRYPPRPAKIPKHDDEDAQLEFLELLSTWPVDGSIASSALFDGEARFRATRLPSQKSINRRKTLAPPGAYPSLTSLDQPIPIMLLTSRQASGASQGTWTLLSPWKCILPIWYGLVHYPLSSGGNPRFGGLQELRQIQFEHGVPWFPTDYPGTQAGFEWELEERAKRKKEWEKRPKGKRIEWDSLDLGRGRKGELGRGWASDFEHVLGVEPSNIPPSVHTSQDTELSATVQPKKELKLPIEHLSSKQFGALLSSNDAEVPSNLAVASIRIKLVTRGVASPCARIYRLPQRLDTDEISEPSILSTIPPTTRDEWLSLLPQSSGTKPLPNPKKFKDLGRIPLNTPLPQRVRLLAQSLLQNPPLPFPADKDDGHPLVPNEEDLIGFVTTGGFNLAEGKGVAMGTVLIAKVLEGFKRDGKKGDKEGRLCIIRNAGEKVGRLGKWEVV
jgi:ribonuclease P/MRP protein subunit POP1